MQFTPIKRGNLFMKSGYNDAIILAKKKLERLDPEKVCALCGASFENEKYTIKWMSKDYELSLGSENNYSDALQILFLHYLGSEGTKKPEGKTIAYREVLGAAFYEPKFNQRAIAPLVKCFGKNPEKLIEAGRRLGGIESGEGDAAVKINLLPYLPVTYIIWAGDGEMPPSGIILFDKTAPGWLCAEDLAVAGSLGAYELISKN